MAIATGCTGATDSVTVTGAGAIAGAGAVTGVGAGTGASDLPEPGAAEAQFAIVRFDDPEFELPSRVSAEVHDDDAAATPSPLGIGTVCEDVLPANDAVPWIRRGAPLAGVNTTFHAGVFRPPFPFPDALK